jgi:organic hydroperoxide reductase OsmC/OhrA
MKTHHYNLRIEWTGNLGTGTNSYRAYSRNHEIQATGKPHITGSADPAFRGDTNRYNPEELLLASLSSCHMLWFLHLCSVSNIIVTAYQDDPRATMIETPDGAGRFSEVCLQPLISLERPVEKAKLDALHEKAHRMCFIANSVNFPVRCEARLLVEK